MAEHFHALFPGPMIGALGDGGVQRYVSCAQARPERYEEDTQQHYGGGERSSLGAERSPGPVLRARLRRSEEGRTEGPEAANGEAVDRVLEEVPGDVQTL